MTETITISDPFPEVAIEALRKLYPHPRNRKLELVCVHKTLERLVQGETGSPMTPAEAITYLRGRLEAAALSFAGRSKAYTPHLTTYLNGRRYLTATPQDTPKNLEEAISVLACYPTITTVDVHAHMPILQIIDQHIEFWRGTHGPAAASYLRQRTMRFAEIVARWPTGEFQFIPGADRWFRERRYELTEKLWERTAKTGFESERAQISRLM